MHIEIQGQLEKISYINEENGYTIAKMKVKGHRELITITGNLLPVTPGEILKLKGIWYNHPKYGEQIKVTSYESVIPATVKSIKQDLCFGFIKRKGGGVWKRILTKFWC